MREEIGKRITEIRNNMGMNKRQFAKYVGITAQYLGTIERGENCLSIEKVIKFCQKTNISTDYLLLGKTTTIDNKCKNILSEFNESQIEAALKMIQNLAIFMKDYKTM